MKAGEHEYKFKRIDDDRFVVIVDGKEQSIFRIKNWLNGLKNYPKGPGIGKTNRFSITSAQYNGFFE